MGLSILIVVVILGIAAVIVIKQYGQTKSALNDDSIIKRDADFMEKTETFTLHNADFTTVIAALKEIDFGKAGISVNGSVQEGAVNFKGSSWSAKLLVIQGEGEVNSYMFVFTGWKTYRGMAQDFTSMNMTLTAVEKMFLKLDPNTKVETRKNQTKTKPSFL